MEKDIDEKLYNDYLNGDKETFEFLYNKYKDKIKYFVFNIVKNNEKAEDIVQDTFIYIFKNKKREGYSFKNYVYLVAKSKALNSLNLENRRKNITEKYMSNDEQVEKDVIDVILKEETKKELLNTINMLDYKYRNALYLTSIEGFSYKQTAKILGQSVQNVKNLIHRGKKQLVKALIKKGFNDMNKVSKIIIMIICSIVLLSGIVYATNTIYKKFNKNHNITFNPSYNSTLDEKTINNIWIGTLDLAWKDLKEKIDLDKIEIEGENLQIVDDLNESTFSKDMIDPNDYEINVERTFTDGYKINTKLEKELNFLQVFDNFSNEYKLTFANGEEYIKYFGINNASPEKMNKNVEILFYNKSNNLQNNDELIQISKSKDFAVKLKTKEGDEIILYRTDDNKTFEEYYDDINLKTNNYKGSKEFSKEDELRIPYIRINGMINYKDLYGKKIKNSKGLCIYDVIQNVNFSLNEKGCNLSSKATMVTEYLGIGIDTKFCYFTDTFIVFMKEKDCDRPYFALKVDNSDILEKIEETDEPKLIDYTAIGNNSYYDKFLDGIEYKFYEDENYEYYYTSQKTKVVQVSFKDGKIMTVEQALKEGKITIDLLDKYECEYIKKKK